MNPPSPPSAVSQSVLLFDSDVNARNALKKMISIYQPNLQVVGESETEDGFRIRLENDGCDLAIIDVRSQDDPIFETLNHFPDPGFHIIFTTANKDFPPEAFRYKAVGYLFKPVESKAFAQAVETLWNREYRSMVTYMMALLEKEQKDQQHSKLVLSSMEGLAVLEIRAIVRLESDGCYTTFYAENGERTLVTKNIKEFEKLLPAEKFARVHTSHIVNVDFVKKFLREINVAVMSDGSQVPISRRKKSEFLKMLWLQNV